jgi:hypothetical protein
MRRYQIIRVSCIVIVSFVSGMLFGPLPPPPPAYASPPPAAGLDDVVPVGMTLQLAIFLDRKTGNIWYYDLDKGTAAYAGTLETLGKPLARSSGSAAAFSFLGGFSNQAHFDLKHSRRTYRVELWRDSVAGVVGHLYYPTEVELDTPRGCVERAKYDASTGALTFQARLWAGESEPGVAVHDIHEFAGRLTASSLEGIFKRHDERRPGGQTERVELKREHVDAQREKFASLAAWREYNPKIGFKYCGPKTQTAQ